MTAPKQHVMGPSHGKTWCGRDAQGSNIVPSSLDWERPEVCGSCYRAAERAQIRDADAAEKASVAT